MRKFKTALDKSLIRNSNLCCSHAGQSALLAIIEPLVNFDAADAQREPNFLLLVSVPVLVQLELDLELSPLDSAKSMTHSLAASDYQIAAASLYLYSSRIICN